MTTFSIPTPSDWHVHFRDDDRLPVSVSHTSRQMHYTVVMPNLVPPITTATLVDEYHERVKPHIKNPNFTPLYTLYLTSETTTDIIQSVSQRPDITGFKLYPAGATTNSQNGVADIKTSPHLFEALEKHGVPLLIHGEVTRPEVDIFDREKYFFDEITSWLIKTFPALRITHEHITTKDAVEFVSAHNLGATITPQHLLYNRNALFAGNKIRPHNFCLPILKAEEHRLALIEAATSGNPKFFAGTDSAPHLVHDKECACGCAGCYTAGQALELYAQAFDCHADLSLKSTQTAFTKFMSQNGCQHYGYEVPKTRITLQKTATHIPKNYPTASDNLVPFMAGETLDWSVKTD